VSYKFVINAASWEGNVGPNGTQNRSLTLTSQPQMLPVVFFNNLADLGAVTLGGIAGGNLALTWTAGPQIRLQTASEANAGTWQDVPGRGTRFGDGTS
jgi:hypothetical protein